MAALFNVTLEGSGRHIHVTRETLDTLFGRGFELEANKPLSQPGQYASRQKVDVAGPKGKLTLTIVGPCRSADQVEVSLTEARTLGINAPIRLSGDLKGSGACTVTGPNGSVDIPEGVIVAKRHLHVSAEDGAKYGLKDGDAVQIKVGGERALIFDALPARVGPTHATFAHIDYDEVNAVAGVATGEVIKL
ncbi:MAG: phosphate propanoyltransferase [Oscillospiraceae bacterium]|jgi:putative phosphotransacetylase|nr:phosphate propanoyltransferase [Oscillospiraceae bacterium]